MWPSEAHLSRMNSASQAVSARYRAAGYNRAYHEDNIVQTVLSEDFFKGNNEAELNSLLCKVHGLLMQIMDPLGVCETTVEIRSRRDSTHWTDVIPTVLSMFPVVGDLSNVLFRRDITYSYGCGLLVLANLFLASRPQYNTPLWRAFRAQMNANFSNAFFDIALINNYLHSKLLPNTDWTNDVRLIVERWKTTMGGGWHTRDFSQHDLGTCRLKKRSKVAFNHYDPSSSFDVVGNQSYMLWDGSGTLLKDWAFATLYDTYLKPFVSDDDKMITINVEPDQLFKNLKPISKYQDYVPKTNDKYCNPMFTSAFSGSLDVMVLKQFIRRLPVAGGPYAEGSILSFVEGDDTYYFECDRTYYAKEMIVYLMPNKEIPVLFTTKPTKHAVSIAFSSQGPREPRRGRADRDHTSVSPAPAMRAPTTPIPRLMSPSMPPTSMPRPTESTITGFPSPRPAMTPAPASMETRSVLEV